MMVLNIVGIIFLMIVLVVGLIIKIIVKGRLKEIDGVGEIHARDEPNRVSEKN